MTQIVGILNITPDSFSDGGLYNNFNAAMKKASELFTSGAVIVDVGAESTRPNAKPLNAKKEWDRLKTILPGLIAKYPNKISLDSYHPENIENALKIGPVIVNDVTGMNNPKMVSVVLKYKPICIISHTPNIDIQAAHKGELINSYSKVLKDLLHKNKMLVSCGLPKENIILDPGIGFGKTAELNKKLLHFAKDLPQHKIMVGYSRKRFLGDDRMDIEPNLNAGKIAAASGAKYIRVHDVSEHYKLLKYGL